MDGVWLPLGTGASDGHVHGICTDPPKTKPQMPKGKKTPWKAVPLKIFRYYNEDDVKFPEHFCLMGLRSDLLKYV